MCSSVYSQAINSAIFKNDINTAIISSLDWCYGLAKNNYLRKEVGEGKEKEQSTVYVLYF